ncbi:MAG: hypothetical protein ACE5OZ_24945 [Candidatus Heimdallarchaeota archaeon]
MKHLKRAFEIVFVLLIVADLADLFFFAWWMIQARVDLPIRSFLNLASALAYYTLIILFVYLMRKCEEPVRKKLLQKVVLSCVLPIIGFWLLIGAGWLAWQLAWPKDLEFLLTRMAGAIMIVGLLYYLYYLWQLAQQWQSSESAGILLLSYGIIRFSAWLFTITMIGIQQWGEKPEPTMINSPLFVLSFISAILSVLISIWLFQNSGELVGLVSSM